MLDLNMLLLAELHETDCRCQACLAFWVENGPNDVSEEGEYDYGPFTRAEVDEASLITLLEDIDLTQLDFSFTYPDSLKRIPDLSRQDIVVLPVAELPHPTCDSCGRSKPDVQHRVTRRADAWLCDSCVGAHT